MKHRIVVAFPKIIPWSSRDWILLAGVLASHVLPFPAATTKYNIEISSSLSNNVQSNDSPIVPARLKRRQAGRKAITATATAATQVNGGSRICRKWCSVIVLREDEIAPSKQNGLNPAGSKEQEYPRPQMKLK